MANPTATNNPNDLTQQQAQKEQIKAQINQQIDNIDQQIRDFQKKVQALESDGQAKYQAVLQDLGKKRQAVQDRLEEFQNSSEAASANLTEGFQLAWENLENSVKKALQQFKG